MTPRPDHGQRGATAVEYGLLLALLAAFIVFAVLTFGGGVTNLFDTTNSSVDRAISP